MGLGLVAETSYAPRGMMKKIGFPRLGGRMRRVGGRVAVGCVDSAREKVGRSFVEEGKKVSSSPAAVYVGRAERGWTGGYAGRLFDFLLASFWKVSCIIMGLAHKVFFEANICLIDADKTMVWSAMEGMNVKSWLVGMLSGLKTRKLFFGQRERVLKYFLSKERLVEEIGQGLASPINPLAVCMSKNRPSQAASKDD